LTGIDHGGVADAVELAPFPRQLAPAAELIQASTIHRLIDRGLVVAGIVQAAGRRAVGKRIGGNEIAADHIERVLAQLDGNRMHHSFQREMDLRRPEAAHRSGRGLVGRNNIDCFLHRRDGIGAGAEGMRPDGRCRHGRAQIGAVIVPVMVPKRQHPPVLGIGRCDPAGPVGHGVGGGEVLQAILDPFDRPPRHTGCDAHQYDRHVENKLDPEGAAGVRRGAQAQAIARHAQRPCHHGVQGEGPLEVREDVIAVLLAEIFRDHRKSFHRRDGVAREMHGQLGTARRRCKRAGNIAVHIIS
jgi:hypothetical protein